MRMHENWGVEGGQLPPSLYVKRRSDETCSSNIALFLPHTFCLQTDLKLDSWDVVTFIM